MAFPLAAAAPGGFVRRAFTGRELGAAPLPASIYFGEFGNNTQDSFLPADCAWMLNAACHTPLLAAFFAMPFSTTAQRLALRSELIRAYNPVSQGAEARTAAGKHAAVTETHAQGWRDPLPPPEPRRRIGFLP